MPRKSRALISTDREVYAAKSPPPGGDRSEYRIAGAPGLVLRVTCDGRRSFVAWLKRRKTGGWQKYTIGAYPTVTLARAKQEMLRLKTAVLDGKDPFEERAAGSGILTVKTLGETFITRYAKPKKRSWAEDERKLNRDVNPTLGNMRADLVTRTDVVRLLDAIHDRGAPVHANRTLSLVRKLFNWAAAEGYLTVANPALGIPMRAKECARTRTLTEDEIRGLWHGLEGPGFDDVTADALRLQLLLGARIREVTGMKWTELALEQAIPVWTLPAARSKSGRDVTRPLPPTALAIIRGRLDADESEFVFASPIDSSQSIIPEAPTRALSRAAKRGLVPSGFTPHDLRRTCRTFWAKHRVEETVAKKLLGHAPPKSDVTASVYDQYSYLPEMRRALVRWERTVLAIVSARGSELGVAA